MPEKFCPYFIFILCCLPIVGFGQGVTKVHIDPGSRSSATTDTLTAIAIKADWNAGGSVNVIIGEIPYSIPYDPDAPDFTYFRSLPRPVEQKTVEVLVGRPVELYLINSGRIKEITGSSNRLNRQDCTFEFDAIPQSTWRSGLPAPNYARIFTEVSHVVVHHSAGSNSNTNYTQVVRDIYLYHTNTNGWSDIGYNYLIAQDGSIFTGRDPASGEQDNVMGAHFCAANSTTMGVCLLGNYETTNPTQNALMSLRQITAFKLDKEKLSPFENYPHAFGPLGAIIGHRDGCSTLCPGESIYNQLNELRSTTETLLEDCDTTAAPEFALDFSFTQTPINAGQSIQYENKSSGYTSFRWYFEGGNPETANSESVNNVQYRLPGTFGVQLVGYSEERSDTLTYNDLIQVKGAPVIYPNPVSPNETLRIAAEDDLISVHLIDLKGQKQELIPENGAVTIPMVRSGIYLLRVKTSERLFTKKLRVE